MKPITDKQKKEYDTFMNEQFRVLEIHFSRCMKRCHNKMFELMGDDK